MKDKSHNTNLLFICSRNQWRSPTAEQIWRRHAGVQVRSAGTSNKAKRTVTCGDIQWADLIFVMESKHKKQIQQAYREVVQSKTIYVLDIPDEYKYMDPELVDILYDAVGRYLE